MIIEIDESFKKDFLSLKNKEIEKRIIQKLNQLEKAKNLNELSNLKKMKWFDNFFRLRVWDYRIWFEFAWNKIVLLRVRSRKDIYNIFP